MRSDASQRALDALDSAIEKCAEHAEGQATGPRHGWGYALQAAQVANALAEARRVFVWMPWRLRPVQGRPSLTLASPARRASQHEAH